MSLKLNEVKNEIVTLVDRKFESMGKGLLLVRLDFNTKNQSPYHWFLEDDRKPPFDIAFNPDNGLCSYIKFFFQDEKILIDKKIDIGFISKIVEGVPIFDLTSYNEKNYQIFENGIMVSCLINNDLFLLIKDKNIGICINVDSKTSLYFDKNNLFTGLQIKSLTDSEINVFKDSDIL